MNHNNTYVIHFNEFKNTMSDDDTCSETDTVVDIKVTPMLKPMTYTAPTIEQRFDKLFKDVNAGTATVAQIMSIMDISKTLIGVACEQCPNIVCTFSGNLRKDTIKLNATETTIVAVISTYPHLAIADPYMYALPKGTELNLTVNVDVDNMRIYDGTLERRITRPAYVILCIERPNNIFAYTVGKYMLTNSKITKTLTCVNSMATLCGELGKKCQDVASDERPADITHISENTFNKLFMCVLAGGNLHTCIISNLLVFDPATEREKRNQCTHKILYQTYFDRVEQITIKLVNAGVISILSAYSDYVRIYTRPTIALEKNTILKLTVMSDLAAIMRYDSTRLRKIKNCTARALFVILCIESDGSMWRYGVEKDT
jgi:hypothetical protein